MQVIQVNFGKRAEISDETQHRGNPVKGIDFPVTQKFQQFQREHKETFRDDMHGRAVAYGLVNIKTGHDKIERRLVGKNGIFIQRKSSGTPFQIGDDRLMGNDDSFGSAGGA